MELSQFIKKSKINALNHFNFDPYKFYNHIVFIQQFYIQISVTNYILEKTKCTKERMINSFKMVNLNEDICDQDVCDLSLSEKLKIELAISLILNEEEIVIYQFDKYFMEKDLVYFKRLLKKLVLKYNKTVVLIDCSLSFMLDFVERLVILKDEAKVLVYDKKDFFNNELEDLLDLPNIIDFQKYVNRKNCVLNNCTDLKELIKAIYREVH